MDITNISWPLTIALVFTVIAIVAAVVWQRKPLFNFLLKLPRLIQWHFFCALLNEPEAKTILMALGVKKPARKYWYFNNLVIPLAVIYVPFLLTLVSSDFQVIHFNKGLAELTLTGSFTMIGINVIRTNMTLINENLKSTNIADEKILEILKNNTESIKSKLRSWIQALTLFGAIAYLIEVANLINPKSPAIKPYVFFAYVLFIVSIYFGRLISVMQTNFADDDDKMKAWADEVIHKNRTDFKNLKQEGKLL